MSEAESGAVPAERPNTLYEPFQRKYNLDAGTPLWKRLFFRYVFLPFNRFCFFNLHFVAPDHLTCEHCGRVTQTGKGQIGWLEREGVFSQQWRAEQEAAKYPYGGVEPLAYEAGEGGLTCAPRSLFPNSVARRKYERKSQQTVSVEVGAMQRLRNALQASSNGNGT